MCILKLFPLSIAALAAIFTGCGTTPSEQARSMQATSKQREVDAALVSRNYRNWATKRLDDTERAAAELARAIDRKDVGAGKVAYRKVLTSYEAMRPAAEQFPDEDRDIAARRSEALDGEWSGLRPLELALFKNLSWTRSKELAKALMRDLAALKEKVVNASFDGRTEVRAASHLLSDIQAYDLAGRSEQYSGLSHAVAEARLEGAMALWAAYRPVVQKRQPQLVALVENSLRRLNGALKRGEETRLVIQKSDDAANDIAETAVVFR